LSVTEFRIQEWIGDPPEPFAAPEYYRGVLWRRVLAYCIDLLALGFILVMVAIALGALTVLSIGFLSPLWVIYGLTPLAYHTLLIGGQRSATLGMRLFRIEVRSWTGERPNYIQALVQTVLFYLTTAATLWLILLVAPFNRRKRTVHDLVAGTLVIRRFPLAEVMTPD